MSLHKKIVLGIILLLVAGGVFYFFSGRDTSEPIQTEIVKRGDVAETVSVTGELVPEVYADIAFLSPGTIDMVYVKIGDEVRRGDKIASIDREVLFSQLKEARLATAITEENEKLARRSWDALKPEERTAKELASRQAREKVRTLEAQMRENVLVAPIAGKISQFDARLGEVVTLGKKIARVVAPGDYILKSRVPESDIAKIALGMKADITFDAFSNDERFEGEVIHIDSAATVVQDVVSYEVKFRLSQNDERLKEGMTGNIDIETAKRTNVLWVPFRALVKEDEKTYAEVKRGLDQFEKVEVVTGLEGDEGTIEVKTGLKEGDEVTIGATQKK